MDDNIKISEKWKQLTISNDFIFNVVMKDEVICKRVLEMLLNKSVGEIKYIDSQKVIDITYTSKGVRLDVYVEDEKRIYNIEMQIVDKKDLPKRSRYYTSMIDLNTLGKGEIYKNLKDSVIIFICKFDPFDANLPRYTFKTFCEEEKSIALNDGNVKIFFNTKAFEDANTEDLKSFLEFVETDKVNNNELVEELYKKINEIKSNEWRKAEYMKLELDLQEKYNEGLEKGIQNLIETLKELNIDEETIIKKLSIKYNLTLEESKNYFDKHTL